MTSATSTVAETDAGLLVRDLPSFICDLSALSQVGFSPDMLRSLPPPKIEPNVQFHSQAWLGLAIPQHYPHPRIPEHRSAYELSDAIIGVVGWKHGMRATTSNEEIDRIRGHIYSSMRRPADARLSYNSIFVDWDTGVHESGCFEADLSGPRVVTQLFDPRGTGGQAYAHASCYSTFIEDKLHVREPIFGIHPVFYRYGVSCHQGRPHCWWRRYGSIQVEVRAAQWDEFEADLEECLTGVKPPGPRHPEHLEEWTQMVVFMAQCPSVRSLAGCAWNSIAEEWQLVHRADSEQSLFGTLRAILDEFETCPHPNLIAFMTFSVCNCITKAIVQFIRRHAIEWGNGDCPHLLYGEGPDFVLIHRMLGGCHRGECRSRKVRCDAHAVWEVTLRLAFPRKLPKRSRAPSLPWPEEMVIEACQDDISERVSSSEPPSPVLTSGGGYIVNPIGMPITFSLRRSLHFSRPISETWLWI